MLDLNVIRENPEKAAAALLKKNAVVDFKELLEWDELRRQLVFEMDELRHEKNKTSKTIPEKQRAGEALEGLYETLKALNLRIDALEKQIDQLEQQIQAFLEVLPNMPDEDVAPGGKENNRVVRTFGEKPVFDFETQDHVALAKAKDLVDFDRGTKLGGNGFWVYKGKGAILEWALINYFVETHIQDGYEFILPPHILNYDCGVAAGQFPKYIDEVYTVAGTKEEKNIQFMIPTSETALINLYRGEILKESELPKKFFSYTPCYRVEAGSHRTSERGTIRGHQFNKVEMFQYTKPEDSSAALEALVAKAEALMQGLGLHYQVSQLAAQDCSPAMAKTFDIEVWIPSIQEYKEVSSASNARDYQARRGMIRFKREGQNKTEFLHTLNASGLATSRLMPALLEQFQEADGRIRVPDVLRKWLGCDYL